MRHYSIENPLMILQLIMADIFDLFECAAKYDLQADPNRNCVDISKAYDLMKKHPNIVGVIQNSALSRYHVPFQYTHSQ